MEYLDGPTLKELLVRKGPTPPLTAIKFAREILSALAEAHRNEIVHRDIKPHNVIVSPDWQIKVTDFGIAQFGASQMTEVGSIVGTAQYLSPEQARGAPVDQRSDLYSLGIVLYEMLTGTVPFTGDAAVEIAMKHLTAVPDPPSKLRPEISHELDAVVMRALAKDPDQRYASAEEMDADLARVARGAAVSPRTEEAMTQVLSGAGIASAPTIAQRPQSAAPPAYRPPGSGSEPPRRRRSLWPTILGLLALVIAAAGGYLIYHRVISTLGGSSTVAVEDVRNVAKSNAELLLHAEGLLVRFTRSASTTVADGLVIKQDPGPGQRVKKRSIVTLTISTGRPTVTVPEIKGDGEQQAITLLRAADLTPTIVKLNSQTVPANDVMASDPREGSTVFAGTSVLVHVSLGPKEVAVPNVISEPYANAASAIQGAGFVPVESQVNSAAPINQVTGETPAAGALEPPGTKVTLTVSKGPKTVAVQNVVGDNQADAVQILTQLGFNVTVTNQDVTDPTQAGLVLSQSPAGGKLAQGGSVTLTVGSLVTPTTTPVTTPTPPTTTGTTTTVTPPTQPGTTTTATTTTGATTTTTVQTTTNPATTTGDTGSTTPAAGGGTTASTTTSTTATTTATTPTTPPPPPVTTTTNP